MNGKTEKTPPARNANLNGAGAKEIKPPTACIICRQLIIQNA